PKRYPRVRTELPPRGQRLGETGTRSRRPLLCLPSDGCWVAYAPRFPLDSRSRGLVRWCQAATEPRGRLTKPFGLGLSALVDRDVSAARRPRPRVPPSRRLTRDTNNGALQAESQVMGLRARVVCESR